MKLKEIKIPSHVIVVSDSRELTVLKNYLSSNRIHVVEILQIEDTLSNVDLVEFRESLTNLLRYNHVSGLLLITKTGLIKDELFKELKKIGLPIILFNEIEEEVLYSEVNIDRAYIFSPIYLAIKRIMDVIGSIIGIIVMLITAILIYPVVQSQSKGPLFFKQQRVGKNGKIFNIYKFRSMYLDAEERKEELLSQNSLSTDLMFKMDNDPRIFPFGQKLRNWSLDELPQFINVLKGEMSLVGTRPPTVDEYQKYELHHFKRLIMKPGITGMWQVSGRSNISNFEDVVRLDESYIKNCSIIQDFQLLLKTIIVVLKKVGSK